MRLWPPRNKPPGTEWVNANPATGERGSIVEARAIDHSQQEIVNAITRFGLTPDEHDREQLGKAIENKIQSETGGGDTASFATIATLRSKLRFYPETTTADGRLAISSPSAGTIFVAATGSVIHRSIFEHVIGEIPELDRTFSTLPSKVYHLLQNLNSGALSLRDVTDSGYNPGGLPETDKGFDSSYDQALHARIVTNSSNEATITPLVNRSTLQMSGETALHRDTPYQDNVLPSQVSNGRPLAINWARTPRAALSGMTDVDVTSQGMTEISLGIRVDSRYSALMYYQNNSGIGANAAFAYEVWA